MCLTYFLLISEIAVSLPMMVEKLPSKNHWSVGDICSTLDDISVSCADQTGPPNRFNLRQPPQSHRLVSRLFLCSFQILSLSF